MAKVLGMETAAYAKYETRSPIPSHRVFLFCSLVLKDPAWLLTGNRWPDHKHQAPYKKGRRRA